MQTPRFNLPRFNLSKILASAQRLDVQKAFKEFRDKVK